MSDLIIPIAILKLPRENGSLITFARAVHQHMSGNASFPSPTPTLAAFEEDITALAVAEANAASKGKGAAKARNAKRKKVKEDLQHLCDYVQSVVETQATSREAAAVVESAFMSVRKTSKRSKSELSAKNAGVSGTVALNAKRLAPPAAYYWQYSLDQETWTSAPTTLKASTALSGLTSRTTYYFRFRALTRDGETDFSQVVSLFVL